MSDHQQYHRHNKLLLTFEIEQLHTHTHILYNKEFRRHSNELISHWYNYCIWTTWHLVILSTMVVIVISSISPTSGTHSNNIIWNDNWRCTNYLVCYTLIPPLNIQSLFSLIYHSMNTSIHKKHHLLHFITTNIISMATNIIPLWPPSIYKNQMLEFSLRHKKMQLLSKA